MATTTERVTHTPGPWEFDTDVVQPVEGEFAGCHICRLTLPHDGLTAVRDANARLIAAAPEMLAALKIAEWGAESPRYGPSCPCCESFRSEGHESDCVLAAAIAKAEGK